MEGWLFAVTMDACFDDEVELFLRLVSCGAIRWRSRSKVAMDFARVLTSAVIEQSLSAQARYSSMFELESCPLIEL